VESNQPNRNCTMEGNFKPVIIVDTREQTPLAFKNLPARPGTLATGDYSFVGAEELFSVERKSIPDLITSCTTERGRFERELHRLRGFRFARLLVVGSEAEILAHNYRSNAVPKAILHSLWAFEARYNVPVVFVPDIDHAAVLVERWAFWFAREVLNVATAIDKAAVGEPAVRVGTNPSD
jgi:DNA excision repair protein ERCC-4